MAVSSSGLEAGSELSATSSVPAEIVSTVSKDATLCLRELDESMVEHAVAIVVLMIILRAQNVIVVPAMDKFVKESRGCPFGPRVEPGESERIMLGVGQYDADGVRMVNSSYQMSRSVSMPRQRWRK